MPIIAEVERSLFSLAPKDGAMDWDNVGLLLGDPEQPVSQVLVALDITEDVVDEAIEKGCQLIVSHHPLMNCKWLPVQTIREDTPQGHLFRKMLRHDLNAICMHTNLDVADRGVNAVLAETLGLEAPVPLCEDGLGRIGTLKEPMTLADFAKYVSKRLHCNGLRYADAGKMVCKVGVGGGACGGFEDTAIEAGCDTYVTADLSYHQFVDAKGKGINLIDAGHFPTEDPICAKLISYLTEQFPELTVTKATSHKEVIQYYVEGE